MTLEVRKSNLSRITCKLQSVRTRFFQRCTDQGGDKVHGILDVTPIRGKMGGGLGRVLHSRIFVCKTRYYFINFLMAFSPDLATAHETLSPRNILEGIFENFPFRGHLPSRKLQTGTLLSTSLHSYSPWDALHNDTVHFMLYYKGQQVSRHFQYFVQCVWFRSSQESKFPNFHISAYSYKMPKM